MALRSVFDASVLRTEFENAGINPQFIPLIWKNVLQNPNCKWDEIPSLPAAAYPLLNSKFLPLSSTLHSVSHSTDAVTSKLLIKLKNGAFVEAVIMRYDSRLGQYGGKQRPGGLRSTLCVSSQGMGEPLNNYSALVEAIRAMTSAPFHLSPRKITVSTVGIVHAINKLHNDLPNLNLAVSLHAPVQDIRCQIMPAARAFPLEKLMAALHLYQKNSQQKIFIEYIMLDGVNDNELQAHQLGKLLETLEVVVNLIPFNPVGSTSQFKTSSETKVKKFQRILRETYNIRTTVRKEMGQDINGACGQLVVTEQDRLLAERKGLITDIEDLHL
uniref:Radical SAM core domain-containing protein n=1 Tax=Chenopodium quinoa TaxID=63459 RepID=A0A803MNZ1_CHEQI